VAEYGAEIVVVATGSYWVTDGLNGASHDVIPGADASLAWQATPDQLMGEGKQLDGGSVLIFDNDGYFMGVSLAEKLATEGKKVTLMTPMGHIAPYMHFTLEAPNMHRRLHSLGVEIVTYHLPTRFEQGAVHAAHVYDEHGHEKTWEVDGVVLVSQRRSNDALWRELKDTIGVEGLKAEGVDGLYRVGDCEAPGLVADAVFSGHRLAREIDSPDPSIPLPFRRERRVVDAELTKAERAWHESVVAGAA
jgi:dimethylamine/trimethylamine dehydrogenase